MTLKLNTKLRTLTGKKAESLRQESKIPAVIYGHGVENKNLEVDYNKFEKIFKEAGENTIIELNIDGEKVNVLVADIQLDSVKNTYSHIDFHQIRMDEKVNTVVELKFIGESKAVKELGGVFVHNISELEVKCLPTDLIHEIEVDISKIETFEDVIKVGDLKTSNKIEIIGHEENDVVATVVEPREEIEEVPDEASAEAESKEEEEKADNKEGENK